MIHFRLVYRQALDTNGPTDWQAYTTLHTESRVLALLTGGEATPAISAGTTPSAYLARRLPPGGGVEAGSASTVNSFQDALPGRP